MDDSIELQPGSSDTADISSEKSLETMSSPISTDPNDPQKNSYDRVFDISEDNIAEVKDETINSMQVFPIKKVLPKVTPQKPPQPKIISNSGWSVNTHTELTDLQNVTPATSTVSPTITTPQVNSNLPPINQTPVSPISSNLNQKTEPPSKNIFDPSYSNPSIKTSKTEDPISHTSKVETVPANISKFAAEKLPEIPAFKGTFDQKTTSFEPKSFIQKTTPQNIDKTDDNLAQTIQTNPNISNVSEKPLIKEKPEIKTESPDTQTKIDKPITPNTTTIDATLKDTPSKNLLDNTPTAPVEIKKEKSIGSIPLKDITPQNTSSRNTPSNPPAKVLGAIPTTNSENKFDVPENPILKKIRTYESDVADVMSHKNISTASIAIAENKRNQINTQTAQQPAEESNQVSTEPKPDSPKNISKFILMLISIIFIAVGIGGAYYLYSKSIFGTKTSILGINTGQSNSGIIPPDSKVTLDISSMNPSMIVAAIKNEWEKDQNPNTIKEIIITDGQTRVTGPRMVEFMNIDAPDILKRSLTNNWMLGINTDPSGNKDIFVIATTNFFQNAFAGMFQWESVMADDLKLFLSSGKYQGIVNAPNATSTITVNGPTLSVTVTGASSADNSTDSLFTLRGQFEDRTIMNKDVRVFRTSQGKTLFFYSFVDNKTMVVASKEQTLTRILDGLEKKAFVR